MKFMQKKTMKKIITAFICAGIATANAFAATVELTPNISVAEGTVRSVAQVNTAVKSVEEEEAIKKAEEEARIAAEIAAEEAAAAAAAEEARLASLVYEPVYYSTVSYTADETASEVITVNGTALGNYKLTFYCPCSACSEGWGSSTSSGAIATEGRTIAVDPKVIPIGSKVYIEGFGDFIAQDVGGAIKGNKIDIFVSDHATAYSLGVKYANVYLMS